jgi:hypothetical protein
MSLRNVLSSNAVIPANAGIHCFSREHFVKRICSHYMWVPAFAGMTELR